MNEAKTVDEKFKNIIPPLSPSQEKRNFIEKVKQRHEDFKERRANEVVSIAEIQKDKGVKLLQCIDADKKKMSGNDRHNRQNWYSHVKKYISYIEGKAISVIEWMPFYIELADKLLEFKQDQDGEGELDRSVLSLYGK